MASSSSSSPSAPAFSFRSWKYHVFLSFRGEDTRNSFVGHLYSALEQNGIYTYKDDETLTRGESIGPSLMKAIEESQIAIIVFSENYANSSWCLDELVYIMNCKNTRGQIILPIFYDVDPSELRKQKGKYAEAFTKHELENKTKVESWRKTLVDASNIAGWESKDIANRHESKFIKEIVNTILPMLHPVTSSVNDNLIGIETRMQRLKSELKIGSGGVSMIGIWGVGGGGKTTLASSIYSEISNNFDGCCFVENIREKSSKYGLENLQEKILSGVLKQNKVKVGSIEEGKRMIVDRLCRRKVLIVLDDVDHLVQLKALAGSHDWFGEGSRIIITTRDKHLLNAHRVKLMHNIRLLNDDEAIKLFCKLAPQDNRPKEDYEQLSKDVVSYAGGLPLALTVLGPFLSDKDIDEWVSALARLKQIPNDDIVGKLKISFDGLTKVEKDLFLDIACFFRWEKKDRAMEILDACGFHPGIGVKVLVQKALITILDGRFDMHDLVQELGHHIVRGEDPNYPELHSRVWKREDVLTICAMDATTEVDMIEAIRYDSGTIYGLSHLPPVVANTKNLRWIDWQGDLASPLLTKFPQRKLCCLILHDSLQKQLWEGYKNLPTLKIIELYGLDNLLITPDFRGLPNLERFKLIASSHLEEIHPSIGHLERLVFLSIETCSRLKRFPPITRLKKLKTLSFSECPGLFKLSEIQQEKMDNLPHLHLDSSGVTEVQKPGKGINVKYWLEGSSLPRNNMNHIRLCFFRRDLRTLNLSLCNLGDEDISSSVWELPNLQELDLSANRFSRLCFSLLRLPRLKFLNVTNCLSLAELSELPSSIAILMADECLSLERFGDISKCKWLWKLSLHAGYKVGPLGGDLLLHSMLQTTVMADSDEDKS
ncbi:disease resistance protein Roq1 isoform X2 [Lactuca sativa]|uniref:disease resistance protein Roq1 isoform X2 n=1 Tax=Lactuca sativa TaxID=4236 RepID=UPI000CD96612|nr:disease resistance protein Roq1 isoform X2 [Lactuca sativa]